MKDMVAMFDGTVLVNVHTIDQCNGQPRVIHNPSQHHMATWPHSWDDVLGVMFRRCPHGDLHPDPDDVSYLRRIAKTARAGHYCDGCCQPHAAPAQPAIAAEPQRRGWRHVEHEPQWEPAQLRYNAAGDTRPGFICTHQLENGNGECGGNVFSLDQAIGTHTCIVNEEPSA